MRLEFEIIEDLDARDLLELARECAGDNGVQLHHLVGRSHARGPSHARQDFWRALRRHPEAEWSWAAIANLFGRDHTTIRDGVRAAEKRARAKETA